MSLLEQIFAYALLAAVAVGLVALGFRVAFPRRAPADPYAEPFGDAPSIEARHD